MFHIFSREGLISFLYTLPALLISLAIHEFAHSFTAYKLGDNSQKALGRLTLHPFAHIDILGFISIVLFGFGWGKPVMVDDRNFKNRDRDNMLVSLAGPLSNLLLAVIFTLILKLLIITGVLNASINSAVTQSLITMLMLSIQFNVVFGIFNLIPLPPFDGSKVLFYFLPRGGKNVMYTLERYSFYIILIFFVTGIGSYLVSLIVNLIYNLITTFIIM